MTSRSETELVPAAPEVEAQLVASCLLAEAARVGPEVQRLVDDATFTRPFWRACWSQILAAWALGEAPDPITIACRAAGATGIDEATAIVRVVDELALPTTYAWNALPRARYLRELAIRRSLIDFGTTAVQGAANETDLDGVLAYTRAYAEQLDALRADQETGDLRAIGDEVRRKAESGQLAGWKTGIPHYDLWSGGLHRGEIHMVGGPPGIGKTWVLVHMANYVADLGLSVAIFSLEMSAELVWLRLLANRIGMKAFRLRSNRAAWTADELEEMRAARAALDGSGIRIFTRQQSVSAIAGVVRQYSPQVVLVDYLQLLAWPTDCPSEYAAITANTTALQGLARRAECCVVAATQQSREAMRAGPSAATPGGSGSGRIDQVADFWLLIQKGERGLKFTPAKVRNEEGQGEAYYRLDKATGRLVPL